MPKSKIENITATIPVTGQSYTDLRPTISASSIDEYRQLLAEVGRLAGNDAFVQRMENNRKGFEKITTSDGDIFFNKETHEYEDEEHNKFITASTWAHQFEMPFEAEKIATKLAEKGEQTVDEILAMWDAKKETSLAYGTAVHKSIEFKLKYGQDPNNAHLASLAQDAFDLLEGRQSASEVFVCVPELKACGTIDLLIDNGNKHVTIVDFKTGDVYKKASLTKEARDRWGLKNETLSTYQLQLSFYACLLKEKGYHVDGIEVWAEGVDLWEKIPLQILPVKEYLH